MKPFLESGRRQFLYVPQDERGEAETLGAVLVPGDARMAKPRPLPMNVSDEDFERWRTVASRYRWCLEVLREHLGDLLKLDPGVDGILRDAQQSAHAGSRVFLFAGPGDAERLRRTPGVFWDRRRRLYYATRDADLNALFTFLTPEAKSVVDGERTASRALDALVQEQARLEVKRRSHAGGSEAEAVESADAAPIRPGGAER